jgi:hypothetical protein
LAATLENLTNDHIRAARADMDAAHQQSEEIRRQELASKYTHLLRQEEPL